MEKQKTSSIIKLGLIAAFIFVGQPNLVRGQNPILEGMGVSDPHVRVFNDTIYLYSGHDATPLDKTWVMRDWRVFSTTDLRNWTLRDTISPKDNYMDDNTTDCWAGDAATRNGKYYFYFSDRKRGVGVMTSPTPTGPFNDPLGKPLVAPMHDPTLIMDDDANRTPYLVYGDKEGGGFHIAKLNEDMISTAEVPKKIEINGEEWDNAPEWMDKNYIFKHEDTYYLSWGRDYAVSKNIYGPYESVGSVANGHHLSQYAHGSFFEWKGQLYHIWCYYLRPGYKFRGCIITYCHMDDDGNIVTDTDFLDEHKANGVGQYDASWKRIEAEWFYEKSKGIKKQGTRDDGFIVTNIKNDDYLRFAKVKFDEVREKLAMKVMFEGKRGELKIRLESPNGKNVGQIDLNGNTTSNSFDILEVDLDRIEGTEDIYVVYNGTEGSSIQLDWIQFK
ncbi:MAG: family 43 glycosylhydrolase [Leeuwenhoekiella sp.]